MAITNIEHKGKNIIYLDWRGMTDSEQIIGELRQYANKLNTEKQNVVTLLDLKNASISKELLKAAKELAPTYEQYEDKVAVYGVSPMRKIMLQALNAVRALHITPFNTKEEALDWLVE